MRRIEILNKSYQNPNLHVPIAKLNNYSLKEIFEDSPVLNFDFNNGTTSWSKSAAASWSVANGIMAFTAAAQYNNLNQRPAGYYNGGSIIAKAGHKLYHKVKYKANVSGNTQIQFSINDNVTEDNSMYALTNENNKWTEKSTFRTLHNAATQARILLYDNRTTGFVATEVEYMLFVDVDDKNITLSLSEMDYWHSVYRYYAYKEVIPGFNYPALYIPTEPSGLGNRYSILQLNKTPYGQELEFDNVQLNLLFGLSRNAYDAFKLLMEFIIDNECILEYDYGQGVRYTDVRLINAPKTEMEQGKIIRSKFDFKRITPFYTILQGSTVEVIHTHDWKIKPIVEGTVNTNTVYIEAEDLLTTEMLTVKFDFTSVTKPFNFYYNAETKQILINGVNIGYKYIDLAYGKTFLELEKDIHYEVTTTGITNPVVMIKKWVID